MFDLGEIVVAVVELKLDAQELRRHVPRYRCVDCDPHYASGGLGPQEAR